MVINDRWSLSVGRLTTCCIIILNCLAEMHIDGMEKYIRTKYNKKDIRLVTLN